MKNNIKKQKTNKNWLHKEKGLSFLECILIRLSIFFI